MPGHVAAVVVLQVVPADVSRVARVVAGVEQRERAGPRDVRAPAVENKRIGVLLE
jgi:hypothetical protein